MPRQSRRQARRLVPLDVRRRSLGPVSAVRSIWRLTALLRAERPSLVHCMSLKPIVVGGAAAVLAGIGNRIYAVTGLGYLGARSDILARLARAMVRAAVTGPLSSSSTAFIFENPDDPKLSGSTAPGARQIILGGAGIDPQEYPDPALSAVADTADRRRRAHALVEGRGYRRRGRPAGEGEGRGRGTVALRRSRPREPEGDRPFDAAKLVGTSRELPGTASFRTFRASGATTMSPACPPAAAKACRAPCWNRRPPAGCR